ncbi:alpha/beta fold hydrolase [Sphingomonas sp. TREG-RG-20F-R18-01]|uniref:alpha/beta hydrolase family protein n=1 Tax=Sphingomonas sp. TREG-RG-20F-R18-01 TaxID=2914982 RepID=UPI0032218D58
MKREVRFPNAEGVMLAGSLERPPGRVRAVALFAHCFTCTAQSHAARRVSLALAEQGIATLRFDFTGLGASEGTFADSHFSANVADLVAAADFLAGDIGAPDILIGHSLGGAAVIAAAEHIPAARAVVTIAAPFDPRHVLHLIKGADDLADEPREVSIGGGRSGSGASSSPRSRGRTRRTGSRISSARCSCCIRRPMRPSGWRMRARSSRRRNTPRASSRWMARTIC